MAANKNHLPIPSFDRNVTSLVQSESDEISNSDSFVGQTVTWSDFVLETILF